MLALRRLAARTLWFFRYTIPDSLRGAGEAISPPRLIRRAMSRSTVPRGRWHQSLQHRYRARRLRQFLSPHFESGQTVFDVGANEGEWTAVLRDLGARVIAVEPQARCAELLRARFGDDPQVQIVESAVADAPGRGRLQLAAATSAHSSMSDEWRQSAVEHRGLPADSWPDEVEVGVTTMDALIAESGLPAFAKIDVEGFELKVLMGLSEALPALAFEFHLDMLQAVEACLDRLSQLAEYRYRVFVDEWPDPVGDELASGEVLAKVAGLPPGAWGMIAARRVGGSPSAARS